MSLVLLMSSPWIRSQHYILLPLWHNSVLTSNTSVCTEGGQALYLPSPFLLSCPLRQQLSDSELSTRAPAPGITGSFPCVSSRSSSSCAGSIWDSGTCWLAFSLRISYHLLIGCLLQASGHYCRLSGCAHTNSVHP